MVVIMLAAAMLLKGIIGYIMCMLPMKKGLKAMGCIIALPLCTVVGETGELLNMAMPGMETAGSIELGMIEWGRGMFEWGRGKLKWAGALNMLAGGEMVWAWAESVEEGPAPAPKELDEDPETMACRSSVPLQRSWSSRRKKRARSVMLLGLLARVELLARSLSWSSNFKALSAVLGRCWRSMRQAREWDGCQKHLYSERQWRIDVFHRARWRMLTSA